MLKPDQKALHGRTAIEGASAAIISAFIAGRRFTEDEKAQNQFTMEMEVRRRKRLLKKEERG